MGAAGVYLDSPRRHDRACDGRKGAETPPWGGTIANPLSRRHLPHYHEGAMPRSSEEALEGGELKAKPPTGESSPAPSLVGKIISGRYRVTELIATGGMSSVYLGQHIHMLKHVAIKVLDPKAEKLPELVARFQREAIAGA